MNYTTNQVTPESIGLEKNPVNVIFKNNFVFRLIKIYTDLSISYVSY